MQVVLPNDPDLVDTLARNGVDISVAEGEQQGSFVGLLGNLIFPLIAFAGLFFLFRRGGDQSGGGAGGGMGGMGGPAPLPSCCAVSDCQLTWRISTVDLIATDCHVIMGFCHALGAALTDSAASRQRFLKTPLSLPIVASRSRCLRVCSCPFTT